MDELIILAHRGASGTCPENTLLAFRRALELGATWLELDVQLVDGKLVVFHDETLERTTNGEGLLADCTLETLRRLDAGAGERVPLLREVLELAAGKAQVNIELKGPGTAVPTASLLKEMFARGVVTAETILASSLRMEELGSFQREMPQVRRAPIYEELPNNFRSSLKAFGAWSVHLHKSLITEEVIRLAREENCLIFAWTVNRLAEAEVLQQQGVAGLFTDYPERMIIRKY